MNINEEMISRCLRESLNEYWSLNNMGHGFLGYEKDDVHQERLNGERKHSAVINQLNELGVRTDIGAYGRIDVAFDDSGLLFDKVINIIKQNGYRYTIEKQKDHGYKTWYELNVY